MDILYFYHIFNIVIRFYVRYLFLTGFENIGLMIKLDRSSLACIKIPNAKPKLIILGIMEVVDVMQHMLIHACQLIHGIFSKLQMWLLSNIGQTYFPSFKGF